MIYNIIVVGAKDSLCDGNNMFQANHKDLCNVLSYDKNIGISCYDMMYPKTYILDNIQYVKDQFLIGDIRYLKKDNMNIIIEFCNLLDEYDVNNGLCFNKQIFDYKIAYLACGCCWNKGFPIECIKTIIENQVFYTPFDYKYVNSYLDVISIIHYIYNNNNPCIMEPYIKGLKCTLGSLKWRGSQTDNYASDGVLRELFILIGYENVDELNDEDHSEIQKFVSYQKHWNQLKWSTRENVNKFLYKEINL